MTAHKHAEVIKAWADGAEIQFRNPEAKHPIWHPVDSAPVWATSLEYRVKPRPKKCIPYKRYLCISIRGVAVGLMYNDHTWNPEEHNGFIKWIDTEWQEHEYDA